MTIFGQKLLQKYASLLSVTFPETAGRIFHNVSYHLSNLIRNVQAILIEAAKRL